MPPFAANPPHALGGRFLGALGLAAFLAIYFLSGYSALLYQIVWQRMLAIFSGSDLYATTLIVAAFMAGLGAGSLVGGALADRLSLRWQIGLFALTELAVGGFALISTWWYYDLLYVQHSELARSPYTLALVLFASLLVPTLAMGMTFPLLSKALTPTVELAGRRIGSIYSLNTLGAACGAFAAAWLLLGYRDLPAILRLGARINLSVALLALAVGAVLFRQLSDTDRTPVAQPAAPAAGTPLGYPFSTWLALYALSGFLALALEIVWFRLLGVMLKSNSFTFPHLLAVYLASLAVGIGAGSACVRSARRPAHVFLILQSGIYLYVALSMASLLWAVDAWPALRWLNEYLGWYEPFDVTSAQRAIKSWISEPARLFDRLGGLEPNFVVLYVLVPLLLVAPPTFLMGASFPFLQRAVHDNRSRLGRRVGWLQAANIAGATLGALLVGTIFLHFLGTSWTLRLICGTGVVFPLFWAALAETPRARRLGHAAALASALLAVSFVPAGPRLWAGLHGTTEENAISTERGSGLSLLKNDNADFSSATYVFVNGLGQSAVPYGDIHSQLGILPVMLHPEPRDIAVIGLGSGDTLFGLGAREGVRSITCVEIVEAQLESLRLLHARRPYGGLESILTDRRIAFLFADGRAYLENAGTKYDVIEADALRPTSAFAGNLYSYEYFTLLAKRLKPGGLAVTWAPTERVVETFVQAFPHAYRFGVILIGSEAPLAFDREALRARVESPFTRAYVARAGVDAAALILPFLDRSLEELRLQRSAFAPETVNTDLFPRDEYSR